MSFISIVLLVENLHGQVTIGSTLPPANGALLDLKEHGPDGFNVTASKGLAMPRVTLTDRDNLYPMFETSSGSGTANSHYNTTVLKTAEDANHKGLIVYHTEKCTMDGKGIYVWNGKKWEKVGGNTLAGIALSQNYFDLPSGQDARGAVSAETLTIAWTGAAAPTWSTAPNNGLAAVPLISPDLSGTVGASSYNMTILPQTMPTLNPTNLWTSYESKLTFTDPDCGLAKELILHQTNYALLVRGRQNNSQIIYYSSTSNGNIPVQGNVAWATSIRGTSGLSTVTPESGGANDNTGGNTTTNVTYSAGTGERYDASDITFRDTQSPKRFNDITVSILNCNVSSNDPSLNAWALRAGFTQAEIDVVINTGVDSRITANGTQMHRDQSNNLFFSGLFGTERWMLNNLAATNYAPGNPHSQGRTLSVSYNPGNQYNIACYGYPNLTGTADAGNAALFNSNKRLGLLYTWDAATGGKGGITGMTEIVDGENAATPNVDPQTTQVQGICPNGWHLPSDWEWTQLELELNSHTSQYAGIADANATIMINSLGSRGNGHGTGMKDSCPTPGQGSSPSASNGASNAINNTSTMAPGFGDLLVGLVNKTSKVEGYGQIAYYYTASGDYNNTSGEANAWYRKLDVSSGAVLRISNFRNIQLSVRCKK